MKYEQVLSTIRFLIKDKMEKDKISYRALSRKSGLSIAVISKLLANGSVNFKTIIDMLNTLDLTDKLFISLDDILVQAKQKEIEDKRKQIEKLQQELKHLTSEV